MPRGHPDKGSALREDDLIATYFAPLTTGADEALGLSDDAALIPAEAGQDFVVTSDGLVAGQHFFDDDDAGDIAYKALAVNISDLVAKGADPYLYFLTLALPKAEPAWLTGFAAGLADAQRAFGCQLAGGDTVKTDGPLTLSITAIGKTPTGAMIGRAGAKAGDLVYLSGSIGDAALGLEILRRAKSIEIWQISEAEVAHLIGRYRRPEPRCALTAVLRKFARVAMDVSDGLLGDFETLCRRSHLGGEIFADRLPLSAAASRALKSDADLLGPIVTGGDDYEVLTAVDPARVEAFESAAGGAGVRVTCIGEMTGDEGQVCLRASDGTPHQFPRTKFDHFGANRGS